MGELKEYIVLKYRQCDSQSVPNRLNKLACEGWRPIFFGALDDHLYWTLERDVPIPSLNPYR